MLPALMKTCLQVSRAHAKQVCYYRDKNSINKFQLAKVTAAGVTISEPFALETKWDYRVCSWSMLDGAKLVC